MLYTVEHLIDLVRARVRERAVTMDEAYRQVASEIQRDPEALRGWWGVLGPWWMQAAYTVGNGGGLDALTFDGIAAELEAPAPPKRRRNWMLDLNPMNVILPVADTGRRKRVGDFDREDALAFERMHARSAQKHRQLGRKWKDVAEKLGPDGRLEDAVGDEVLDLGLFPPEYVAEQKALQKAG